MGEDHNTEVMYWNLLDTWEEMEVHIGEANTRSMTGLEKYDKLEALLKQLAPADVITQAQRDHEENVTKMQEAFERVWKWHDIVMRRRGFLLQREDLDARLREFLSTTDMNLYIDTSRSQGSGVPSD